MRELQVVNLNPATDNGQRTTDNRQMTLPLLARYADTLRYDRERGVVLVLDRRVYPGETSFVACADVESLARAIDTTLLPGGRAAAYAAGYGLALAARAWSGRPTDAQRGAII